MLIIEEPAVEYKIQQLLSINPKTWQELKDKGIIPLKGSYKDFLLKLFYHYKAKNEVAIKRAEASLASEGTYKNRYTETESGLPKVIEAEKIQKIKLDKAREQQLHLQNLSVRNELINKSELQNVLAPLVSNIANILRSAAEENPDFQTVVDRCFLTLYSLGEKLVEQSESDRDSYVKHMLERPVNFDAIIDSITLDISE